MTEHPTLEPDDLTDAPEPFASESGLKPLALKGGRDLAAREIAGVVLSTISTIVVLRVLGTAQYGVVGFGLAISSYTAGVSTLGLNVFLVRRQNVAGSETGQVLSMAAMSAAVVALTIALLAPLAARWVGDPSATIILRVVAVMVFFRGLSQIPVALLEREMAFDAVAKVEFGSLAVYYALLFPLVLTGWGPLGVWLANTGQVLAATVAYFATRPVRPALRLEAPFCREALRFGVGYQGSSWVYAAKDLAAPILLPRLAGASALGVFSVAQQLVLRLGFMKTVIWRVALPGLARAQSDPDTMRRRVDKAMMYVVVLLGGALSLIAALAGWLVPLLFSDKWTGVPLVLPYLSVAAMLAGLFSLHSAALVSGGAIGDLTKYHAVMLILVWAASLALIPVLGVVGSGVAEIVGCAAYLLLGGLFARRYGRLDYGGVLWVALLLGVSMVASAFVSTPIAMTVWAFAVVIALVTSPASREVLSDVWSVMLRRGSTA